MKTPKISVIMSVYNAEKFVSKTIDSILMQKFIDFEFLIVDDCSSDKSFEIISNYNDSRIKVFRNEKNLGYIQSLNKLIFHSAGDYIARQDHDDISLPNRLKLQVHFMENNPDVGICGTNARFFGEKKSLTSLPTNDMDIRSNLIIRNPFIHSSIMIRRKLFLVNDTLKYDISYYPAEDYYLWFNVSIQAKLANLPNVLLLIRWHRNNVSSLNESIQIEKFNNIRYKILEHTLSIVLTEEEKRLHNLIPSIKNISFSDISLLEKWYLKILVHNEEKNCLSASALHKVLLTYWTIACFRTKDISLLKRIKVYSSSKIFKFSILLNLISYKNFKNILYKY